MKKNDCDCLYNNEKEVVFSECCDCLKEEVNASFDDTGKLLCVRVNLKNVEFNRYIAVGVMIFDGRKMKAYKVKEIYTGCYCSGLNDIQTPKYYFVFKDDNNCLKQKYNVKVIANYICK